VEVLGAEAVAQAVVAEIANVAESIGDVGEIIERIVRVLGRGCRPIVIALIDLGQVAECIRYVGPDLAERIDRGLGPACIRVGSGSFDVAGSEDALEGVVGVGGEKNA